jgi:polysaccharide biosynthesis protein PslG
MRRSLVAAAVSAVAILVAPAGALGTHLSETGSGGATVPWGFNEDWGWSNGSFSAGTANSHMQAAGAIMPDSLSANRFHVEWAAVEPSDGSFDWSRTDAVYAAMQQHTPLPIMMLYNAPGWARDPAATCPVAAPCAFPPAAEHDDEWAEFVQAAVARYPDVRAIEIWNEQNLRRFWAPAPDPDRYSAVLLAAHDAVAAASSDGPVLVGGMFPVPGTGANVSPASFLGQVYENAGAGAFEGIGTHPYPFEAPYVETMWGWLDDLRAVRDAQGDADTPLWITEVGISSAADDGGVPADQQGDILVELYRSIEDHDVASFVIHRLHDIGNEGSFWNQTGVLNEDLTPKPAYGELGAGIGTESSGGSGIVETILAPISGFAQASTAAPDAAPARRKCKKKGKSSARAAKKKCKKKGR